MRIPRVYIDSSLKTGELIELGHKQSNYLCKALRMESGRELWLFNGQGGAFQARINLADNKRAQVLVGTHSVENRQSPLDIKLIIALSKGDRFDLVIQKATELGVTAIQPIVTERTDVRLNAERAMKKLEHWRGIGVSACEQSGRNILPVIAGPLSLNECFSSLVEEDGCRIMMDPYAKISVSDLASQNQQRVAVLIGPEGGLSEVELTAAKSKGFIGTTLGPRILRTETAPLVIIGLLQSFWGDI